MFGMGTGVTLSVRSPETCELRRGVANRDHPRRLRATPRHLLMEEGTEAVDNSILMGKFERAIKIVMISL